MSNVKISVVVPTFEQKLRLKAIVEILCSLKPVDEIIIIDSSSQPIDIKLLPTNKKLKYLFHPGMNPVEKLYIGSSTATHELTLLHPDGELVNEIALEQIIKGFSHKHSSSVAFNFTCYKKRDKRYVSTRNFHNFKHLDPNNFRNLNKSLSPYYQMIWGVHKSSLLKKFFRFSKKIDWLQDHINHAGLFELLFNYFMITKGRVYISKTPLFIRNNVRNYNTVQSYVDWVYDFKQNSIKHVKFFKQIVKASYTEFNMSQSEFYSMFSKALENGAEFRLKQNNVLMKLKRKIFLKKQLGRDLFAVSNMAETSRKEFKMLFSLEFLTWLEKIKERLYLFEE